MFGAKRRIFRSIAVPSSLVSLKRSNADLNAIGILPVTLILPTSSSAVPPSPAGSRSTGGSRLSGDMQRTDAPTDTGQGAGRGAGRGASLPVAKAYFREKKVSFHLDLAPFEKHLPRIGPKRPILTHMSKAAFVRSAEDGLSVFLKDSNAGKNGRPRYSAGSASISPSAIPKRPRSSRTRFLFTTRSSMV